MGDQERRHLWMVHLQAEAKTCHTRLGDFEQRTANAVAVANTDLHVGQAFDGEVLTKLAG